MSAVVFEDLGQINGVSTTDPKPYSKLGRDRDGTQTFMFECDSANPFTGIVWIQGSMVPTDKNITQTWADITSLTFNNEGGTFFLELDMELASVRVICKQGDYTSGRIKTIKTMR